MHCTHVCLYENNRKVCLLVGIIYDIIPILASVCTGFGGPALMCIPKSKKHYDSIRISCIRNVRVCHVKTCTGKEKKSKKIVYDIRNLAHSRRRRIALSIIILLFLSRILMVIYIIGNIICDYYYITGIGRFDEIGLVYCNTLRRYVLKIVYYMRLGANEFSSNPFRLRAFLVRAIYYYNDNELRFFAITYVWYL